MSDEPEVLEAASARDIVRSENGTFPKGVSGNPKGRPKGSKNKITLLRQSLELRLREQAAPDMAGVLNKAVELAMEGDRSMIKLLLELHMSKSAPEGGTGKEKVEITVNGPSTVQPINVIDVSEEDYETVE